MKTIIRTSETMFLLILIIFFNLEKYMLTVQAGLYGQILEQDVEPRPFIYRIMEETHMTTQSHIMERVTMVTKNG